MAVVLLLWGSTSGDRGNSARKYQKGGVKRRSSKGGLVDAEFMKRIKKLLKIVFPSKTCKESKYIAILTLLLVLRT